MKKRVIFHFAAFMVLAFVLLSFHQDVSAERSYYISGYNINAAVNKDGSAEIEEQLTYDYNGQFNGALRDVDFSLSGGIENQKVYVMKNQTPVEYQQNQTDSLDYVGSPGTYNYTVEGSIAHFKIFEPSDNEKKTFVIKYRMLDAVTKSTDTAEFNRKLIGTEWQTNLNNINIKITLPKGATKDQIKVFAHGPLTGESSILDGSNVLFTVPSVSAGVFVETLVLFPNSLVPDSTNTVNKDALPGIMANEQKLANEANAVREEARSQVARNEKLVSVVLPIVLFLIVLWLVLIIYIYIKYDKEPKHSFTGKYYRELPGEYTPAEMSVLLSMGSVQTRDILATLLDLVRKKHLLLTTDKVHKKGILGGKDITRYTISIDKNAPGTALKSHEQYLIDWFVHKIGNGTSVSFDEIEQYVKTRTHALQYRSDQSAWENLVKDEAAKNDFFDKTSSKGRIIGVLLGVLYLILGVIATALMSESSALVAAILIILEGIILIAYSARINRRSIYGNEQHAMWHAFKNFLKDFSSLNKAEIPSIVIWEYYLVYAVSLGVAKEVIQQLPLVFNDADLNNNNLTFMYGASFGYFIGFSSMLDNTIRTVEGATLTAASIASSSNSSGGGFGGGFSGGSSGGGGGGGGGGAF